MKCILSSRLSPRPPECCGRPGSNSDPQMLRLFRNPVTNTGRGDRRRGDPPASLPVFLPQTHPHCEGLCVQGADAPTWTPS